MNTHNNRGFTLIGVLLSVVMLASVSVAVSGLIGRSEKISGLGREKFIASNIAREGIELVHVMRDTNWLGSEDSSSWLEGLCTNEGQGLEETREFTLDTQLVRNHDAVGDVESARLFINPQTREWTHATSGEETPYSRVMRIDCSQREADPATVTVSSRVTWRRGSEDREVVIADKLYNWIPQAQSLEL